MNKLLSVLILFGSVSFLNGADTASRPNVVLVMADDQGWGDTGYNGHPDLKTPNLDDLAKIGLRLNRFYTAHFNCSPTRASIMTGRNPMRMGTFSPGSPIRAQELTVAKVLQSAGYATGHFGKWHLNGQIFWYCSDNGGANGPKSTGYLRGSKGTMWEGGLRVPGLVEWPARIPKPVVSDFPCCTLDMYPTILEATGSVAQNQIKPLDGISLMPLFEGKTESRSKPIPFWAHGKNMGGHAVLLDWPYKLHLNPVQGKGKKQAKDEKLSSIMLFDVSKDPKETTDLAAKEPERIAKMKAQLQEWQASVEKNSGADYAATPKK